jgi:pentatricopeptide repeat protein
LAQLGSARHPFADRRERDSYYTRAVAACGRNWRRALGLLYEFELEASSGPYSGMPPLAYAAAIHICGQGGEWALAIELLESMGKPPRPPPTVRCFEAALEACSWNRQGAAALKLLETMHPPRQVGASSAGNPAATVTGSGARVALHPSVRCLNLAMTACTRQGSWADALTLFDAFPRFGHLVPTEVSYGAAATACEAGGQWERAIALLGSMEAAVAADAAAVAPNQFIYTSVILACGRAKQWVPALEVFDRMQRVSKVKPGVVAYCAVSSASFRLSSGWSPFLTLTLSTPPPGRVRS